LASVLACLRWGVADPLGAAVHAQARRIHQAKARMNAKQTKRAFATFAAWREPKSMA